MEIAAPANHPDSLIVAFASGGLWRTDDRGGAWSPLFDDEPTLTIGSFALGDPDGKKIYVGTGESNSSRTSYAGAGMYKTDDGGKTWRAIGLSDTHHIGKVVVDPRDSETVYVAAVGHLYTENPERGVFVTRDGGKSWAKTLYVDERTGAIDLVQDPKNPDVLYAATWERARSAANFLESGPGSGVWKSVGRREELEAPVGGPSGRSHGRADRPRDRRFAPSDRLCRPGQPGAPARVGDLRRGGAAGRADAAAAEEDDRGGIRQARRRGRRALPAPLRLPEVAQGGEAQERRQGRPDHDRRPRGLHAGRQPRDLREPGRRDGGLPLRRRRRGLEADARGAHRQGVPQLRLLLRPHRRGPGRPGARLHPGGPDAHLHGRREDLEGDRRPRRPRRLPRDLHRPEGARSASRSATTAASTCRTTTARPGPG